MSQPDPVVLTERRDSALWITINRPDARNAMNVDVTRGLLAALGEARAADDLTAVVELSVESRFGPFRDDARCRVLPQSLISEKFVVIV